MLEINVVKLISQMQRGSYPSLNDVRCLIDRRTFGLFVSCGHLFGARTQFLAVDIFYYYLGLGPTSYTGFKLWVGKKKQKKGRTRILGMH